MLVLLFFLFFTTILTLASQVTSSLTALFLTKMNLSPSNLASSSTSIFLLCYQKASTHFVFSSRNIPWPKWPFPLRQHFWFYPLCPTILYLFRFLVLLFTLSFFKILPEQWKIVDKLVHSIKTLFRDPRGGLKSWVTVLALLLDALKYVTKSCDRGFFERTSNSCWNVCDECIEYFFKHLFHLSTRS